MIQGSERGCVAALCVEKVVLKDDECSVVVGYRVAEPLEHPL